MKTLLVVIGFVTLLVAVMQTLVAKSAMHETTAAVLWVGGWLMMGLAVVISRLDGLAKPAVVPGAEKEKAA